MQQQIWYCRSVVVEKKSSEDHECELEVPYDCYKVKAKLFANRTHVYGKETPKVVLVD